MTLQCTRCSRVSSRDARFCWFDGTALAGAAAPAPTGPKTFSSPFVFPSGLSCKNFDDFALGCQQEWASAVEMLHKGFFQQFFRSIGRMDLAQAVQEAASFPDRDRGLDQLLARLPTQSIPPAKLEVQPKLVNLGTLVVGKNSQFQLNLENRGSRLIFGSLSSTSPWLAVTETGDSKLFQFRDQLTLTVQVKGPLLRAGLKPLEGSLLIESNAGTFNLKVVANVPIQPFSAGVLTGARSPREVAEKAKKFPKDAAALFESGAVAKWYQANGWNYPVQGPAPNGIAAVQQFFEALGLAKAPKVFVTEKQIELHGAPGEKLKRTIQVRSDEPRPVYAHAVSAAGWLVVKPALTQGNAVTIPLEITVPAASSDPLETRLRIAANGNQRFEVPIHVKVTPASGAAAAAVIAGPVAVGASTIPISTSPGRSKQDFDFADSQSAARSSKSTFDPVTLLINLAPVVLLGFVLLGLVAKDVFSNTPKRPLVVVKDDTPEDPRDKGVKVADFKVAISDEPDEQPLVAPSRFKVEDEPEERFGPGIAAPVKVEIKDEPEEGTPAGPAGKAAPVDPTLRIRYSYGGNKGWGLIDTATGKKLTFSTTGGTNVTVVRVAGKTRGFAFAGEFKNLPDDPVTGAKDRTSFTFQDPVVPGLKITQILEIVPSKQPVDVGGGQMRRLLNTLLVRYVYENTGVQPVNAGFRQEIDTLIGANDGVPFTVPGRGLVNTSADFTNARLVPDFVQALETGDLRNPGTIVHISLKVGGNIEAPSRVLLCHWASNGDLSNPVATNMGRDSAIVMVWPDQMLPPGKKREMGYAYGLGSVTVADAGGTLAVSLDGNYDIGQSFTVLAYVKKPVAGQTVSLELPPGLERVKGEQTQSVPAPNVGDTSVVTWEAKVISTGVFPVKVKSSTGVTQTKTVSILRGEAPIGGKLSLDLKGDFEPGKTFTVIGKVNEPIANQTLTLQLPKGLQKIAGEETQRVPSPPAGSKDTTVEWQVRVIEPGKYPVRVVSSTGVAQTKTVTIVQPGRAEGAFQILLSGDFAPGKTFTVSTKVVDPIPDQKLNLVLPEGLTRVASEEMQVAAKNVQLTWQVKIEKMGKYTVGVKSTTGVTQRKTLLIEPPADSPGRFNFDLVGNLNELRPGKEFTVKASVTNPVPGQTLTLALPKGLAIVQGETTQTVPAPAGGVAPVSWQVRVVEVGRLPVRIESSTKLTRTKTLTLTDTSKSLFGGN